MAIVSSDILTRFSVTTGAAGNSTAQGNQNLSLGKYKSTSSWPGGVLHDLFDVITGDENAAATVDYRCLFLENTHATITFLNVVMWLQAEVAGGASISIGVDPAGLVPIGQAGAQAATIANENAAPAGVVFSAPTTKGAGISLGSLAPGYCIAVWIRRTAANSAALDNDGATFQWDGDTTG